MKRKPKPRRVFYRRPAVVAILASLGGVLCVALLRLFR